MAKGVRWHGLLDPRKVSLTRIPKGVVFAVSRFYPHDSLIVTLRVWPPLARVHWGQPRSMNSRPWFVRGVDALRRLKRQYPTGDFKGWNE
jgi:hypothetical protein